MSSKKSTKAAARSSKGSAPQVSTVAGYPVLFGAIKSFLAENSVIESSQAIDAASAKIGECTDLQAAFVTPIQAKLFSMDTALHWLLFMDLATVRASDHGEELKRLSDFDSAAALNTIASVYDLAVEGIVDEHWEPEDGSDEEAEDGDDD